MHQASVLRKIDMPPGLQEKPPSYNIAFKAPCIVMLCGRTDTNPALFWGFKPQQSLKSSAHGWQMLGSYLPCSPASVPTRHVSVADVSTPAADRYARRLRSLKYTVGSMTMAAMSIHACRALPNAPPKGTNEGATALKFCPSMMRKSTALHAVPLTSKNPMAHPTPNHMHR